MNMMIKAILILLVISACNSQLKRKINYPGESVPGDSAVVFAPGIVTTGNHEHSRMEFSKDGSELYWEVIPVDTNYRSGNGSPFNIDKQNIWFVKKAGDGWTEPAILPSTLNVRARRPILSMDEQTLYFETDDLDADPDIRPRPSFQMALTREKGEWSSPKKIEGIIPKVEGKVTMLFSFAGNGNIYFDLGGPAEDGHWNWEIYFMKYENGQYLQPVLMGNNINDEEINWCPWISPDESYLIFSSHRSGQIGGGDLYIAFNRNGDWSAPVNMGEKVNTPAQERFPSVSPDGEYLFFARHNPESFSDIYWINSNIIDELERENIVEFIE